MSVQPGRRCFHVTRLGARALCLLSALVLPASTYAADKSGVRPNVIDLPKGPGSISGLGEQFVPQMQMGSASYAVGLVVPQGTSGVQPAPTLVYDSGQGNGPVGIGWALEVGQIQRQTDKGIPAYDQTDRFLYNGQELVPVGDGIYRLKQEGAFIRFRRSATHWEADAPDGTRYRFGGSPDARLEGPSGTFRWAMDSTRDVWGNGILYGYESHSDQLYLARIQYNARVGAADNQVVFEYEPRADALTDYRAGFAVTTARRLKQVRMLSLGVQVRRYVLTYEQGSVLSRLSTVTAFGTDDVTALPTLTFGYTGFEPGQQVVRTFETPPAFSLQDPDTELVDFDGDSLPDLLHASTGNHRVAYNLGDHWATPVSLPQSPSVQLATEGVQLADVDGNGIVDLVAKVGSGTSDFYYYPNKGAGRWEPRVFFQQAPPFSFGDPTVRPLDFDGDGLMDVMQTTESQYYYWRNQGDGSWGAPRTGATLQGQSIQFTDPQVHLADMNGDRLVDLVFIRAGTLRYWPNMGHGRWAAPVDLRGAPDVGADAHRLQLADLDGDGLSDLWLARGTRLELWLQRGDGGLSPPMVVDDLPEANPGTTVVRTADLNGSGTTDVVWNSPSSSTPWRYVDLVGAIRPNLLSTISNGLGQVISIGYGSSGQLFQAARAAGLPWGTRLPNPVQVVERITVSDGTGWQGMQRFEYRDGYFDGPSRQFRGFARTVHAELGDDAEATAISVHDYDLGLTHEALKGAARGVEIRTDRGVVLRRERFGHQVRVYAMGLDGREVARAERVLHEIDHVEGTDAPLTTRSEWAYDEHGNPLTHWEWGVIEGDDRLAQRDERITRTEYVHDAERWLLGRQVRQWVTDAEGTLLKETRSHYDGEAFEGLPLGQLGGHGALTRVEDWVEGDRFVQSKRFAYDAYGALIASLNPLGARSEVEYDATHRFPVVERLILDDGNRLEMSATYDEALGTLRTFTDVAGRTTRVGYDALLRPTEIARPDEPEDRPGLRFQYIQANPLSRVITRRRLSVGGDAFLEQHAIFDGRGRARGTIATSEDGKTLVSDAVRYGARGQVVAEFDPFFANGFDWVAPGSAERTHQFDALGRRTLTVLQDGSTVERRYAPLAIEHWDAEDLTPGSQHFGTPRRERSTGLGIAEVVERNSGTSLSTLFERDGLGRVVGITNAQGDHTKQAFDGLGRVLDVTHPASGHTRFTYDDLGRVLLRVDGRGARVVSTFDRVGRVLTEQLLDRDGSEESLSRYHYDAPSPRFPTDAFAKGQLTWVEDSVGEVHLREDARGRTAETLRVIDGVAHRMGAEYDNLDRVVRQHLPSGRELVFHFNERSLLQAVPGVVESSQYDPRGLLLTQRFANGAEATARYDSLRRVEALDVRSRGTSLQALTYGYDRVGHVLRVEDAVHLTGERSSTRSFRYDDLYRLVTANAPDQTWQFTFDQVGNLLSKTGTGTYRYDEARRAIQVGDETHRYDEAGNLVERPGVRYAFDAKGRLIRVTSDDGTTVAYRYGYDDARVVKESKGPRGTGQTLYVGTSSEERAGAWVDYVVVGGRRIASLGSTPALASAVTGVRGLSFGLHALAAMLLLGAATLAPSFQLRRQARTLTAAGLVSLMVSCTCGAPNAIAGTLIYHSDHLGSVMLQTDERGEAISHSVYEPFGARRQGTSEPYAFTGREWEVDTGLYDFYARAYDPALGRFLSPDPSSFEKPEVGIPDPQLLNPYSYARNSPVNYVDPDGRDAIPVVFPDYKISAAGTKWGGLGHAGIILIDNKTGQTRYYEYGRYDKAAIGETRQRKVPNVVIDKKTGMPTEKSLAALLRAVTKTSGQNTRIEGAYVKDDKFKEMVTYAESRIKENKNSDREPYSLTGNNCGTFMKDVLEAGGHDTPWMVDPRPNSYIRELRSDSDVTVDYSPAKGKAKEQLKVDEK